MAHKECVSVRSNESLGGKRMSTHNWVEVSVLVLRN